MSVTRHSRVNAAICGLTSYVHLKKLMSFSQSAEHWVSEPEEGQGETDETDRIQPGL